MPEMPEMPDYDFDPRSKHPQPCPECQQHMMAVPDPGDDWWCEGCDWSSWPVEEYDAERADVVARFAGDAEAGKL